MCREFISSFEECGHEMRSAILECHKFDETGEYCDPLDEPDVNEFDGKCTDCKDEESAENKRELEKAMKESARLHEEHLKNRKPQQSEEEFEEHMRKALYNSQEEGRPVSMEERMREAMKNSLISERSRPKKLYFKQDFQYLGCGCQKTVGMLDLERNEADPESIVEEVSGRCPDHSGEPSNASYLPPAFPGAAVGASPTIPTIERPVLQPWQNPEEDPVPAYEEINVPGKGKAPAFPRGPAAAETAPSTAAPQGPAAAQGFTGHTEPPPLTSHPTPEPHHLDQDDDDGLYDDGEPEGEGDDSYDSDGGHSGTSTEANVNGPKAPPHAQCQQDPRGAPPLAGVRGRPPPPTARTQEDEGEDYDSSDAGDSDDEIPDRRPVTVSTFDVVGKGGTIKPEFMGAGLGALEEEDEGEGDAPPPPPGPSRRK